MAEVSIDKNTRWECQMCGECCKGIIISKNKSIAVKKGEKWVCQFLDENNKLCNNYNDRPFICRVFPFVMAIDSIKDGEKARPQKAFELENMKIHTECKGYGKGKRILSNKKLKNDMDKMGYDFAVRFKQSFDDKKTLEL